MGISQLNHDTKWGYTNCIEMWESFKNEKFPFHEGKWIVYAEIWIKGLNIDQCVCYGTGLGKSSLHKLGQKLNDSHAEILCRRAFVLFLYNQLEKSILDQSQFIEYDPSDEIPFKLKEGLYVEMNISQCPCGDASMEALEESQSEKEKSINENKRTKYNHDQENELQLKKDLHNKTNGLVSRGRLNYQLLGVLRTKPGRIDADPTSSLSCSDKIARWNVVGLNGALLSLLLKPIYLAKITIDELYHHEGLNRALNSRIQSIHSLPQDYKVNRIILEKSLSSFEYSKSSLNSTKPSSRCSNWYESSSGPELLSEGLKLGSTSKLKDHPKSRSRLSKMNMLNTFLELIEKLPNLKLNELKKLKYKDIKIRSIDYQSAKNRFKQVFSGWSSKMNEVDDFITIKQII